MKSFLFRKDVLELKLRALEKYGEAQTRRLLKPQPHSEEHLEYGEYTPALVDKDGNQYPADYTVFGAYTSDGEYAWKPRYIIGEERYIKEAWRVINAIGKTNTNDFGIEYLSGEHEVIWWTDNAGKFDYPIDEKLRSPLFMPEWAARKFAIVTDVRLQRLQEITPDDCLREGVSKKLATYLGISTAESEEEFAFDGSKLRRLYANLWDSLKPAYTWDSNPFVWEIEFKRIER
jgi:hypothetical protein